MGEIDFFEFIIAATDQQQSLSKQKIAQAFHTFDIDGDGFITEDELKQVMGGIEIDKEMWIDILEDCDDNNDGMISKDEFGNLLLKIFNDEEQKDNGHTPRKR